MIGHYLLTLSEEQEDRILTGSMAPWGLLLGTHGPCLVQRAHGAETTCEAMFVPGILYFCHGGPAPTYDELCYRFGTACVNAAIRNRILSNRARRVLQNRPAQMEPVAS